MWIAIVLSILCLLWWKRGAVVGPAPPELPPSFALDPLFPFAKAIARAEGFYLANTLPARNHNPGALRLYGEEHTITYFPDDVAGWRALVAQLRLIYDRRSSWYSPETTLHEMGMTWTGNDRPDAWTRIVAGRLGVSDQTTLGELV